MKKQQSNKKKNIDLVSFDAKLRSIAQSGAFDDAIDESLDRLLHSTEPTKLSDRELDQFHQTIQKASIERLIMEKRKAIPVKGLPFGRYLHLIRDRCDLTKKDIAKTLNKDRTYVDKIEKGQTNPLYLETKDVADIMQLFRLTLTDLKTTIKLFLTLSASKRSKASAMARSSIKAGEKGREDSLGLAMDAALQAIATKKGKSCHGNIKIDPEYINAIKNVLKGRGEKDLLV